MNPTIRTVLCGPSSPVCRSILAAMLAAPASSIAQTCAAPAAWPDNGLPLSGTTCGGEHLVSSFCNGAFANPGPNYVVRIVLNHTTASIGLIGGGGGFNPVMYLSDAAGSCDTSNCIAVGDTGNAINLANVPSGIYWLIIAASDMDQQEACGSFSLTVEGEAPGSDVIFYNGFQ